MSDQQPERRGEPWTDEEAEQLIKEITQFKIAQIAAIHRRSPTAIQMHAHKLLREGRLNSENIKDKNFVQIVQAQGQIGKEFEEIERLISNVAQHSKQPLSPSSAPDSRPLPAFKTTQRNRNDVAKPEPKRRKKKKWLSSPNVGSSGSSNVDEFDSVRYGHRPRARSEMDGPAEYCPSCSGLISLQTGHCPGCR
jgi:hypothetical protein